MTLDEMVTAVVSALEEIKGRDIVILDVTTLTPLFDRMVLASADSSRQTRALANNVQEKLKALGFTITGVEGEGAGEWILVDLGEIIVHVMQPAVRQYYNLEQLWGSEQELPRSARG